MPERPQRGGDLLPSDWDAPYAQTPPWDIGRPQTPFIELAAAGGLRGAVLELEATFLDVSVPAWLATITRRA